ncbi:MAG: cytidine deaminase [Candidatus Borkfalkiaceae bacterium]|nr:cytidine deaminase [Christensenellaceae bacterium]
MTDKELMVAANEARKFAYTPYSHFKVGAALLTKSGKLYTGCNIENSSYTPTVCAERTAVFKAVSEGESDFAVIAVVGGKEENPLEFCSPCGVCRQVLAEFCGEDFRILLGNPEKFQSYTVDEILPFSFTKKDLNKF